MSEVFSARHLRKMFPIIHCKMWAGGCFLSPSCAPRARSTVVSRQSLQSPPSAQSAVALATLILCVHYRVDTRPLVIVLDFQSLKYFVVFAP